MPQKMGEIRHHISAVEQTRKITNAMRLVSTSRMRRAVDRAEYNRRYFERVRASVKDILALSAGVEHPYFLEPGPGSHTLFIVVASDKGMAGSYNHDVLEYALKEIKTHPRYAVITVGLLAAHFFRRNGIIPVLEELTSTQNPSLHNARVLWDSIADYWERKAMGEVHVIYTAYHSRVMQMPNRLRLLPQSLADYEDVVGFGEKSPVEQEILYAPSPQEVFNSLIPQYILGLLYGALMQSYASEHCARMMAMENATHNAEEMLNKLTMQFNFARQAAITQEISEIAGAGKKSVFGDGE